MIFSQPRAMIFQGMQRTGGDDSGLAHAAAQLLAHTPSSHDDFFGTDQRGTNRRPEALGETDADGIKIICIFAFRNPSGGGGVPQSRAVEMRRQVIPARAFNDLTDYFQRPDFSAAAIVRVFDAEQFCFGEMLIRRPNQRLNICGAEHAVLAVQQAAHDAGNRGGRTGFVKKDMGVGIDQDFVADVGVHAKSDLVRHRPGRYKYSGFFSQQFRGFRFQFEDGWVVAEYIVTDDSFSHRLAHCRGWLGHSIRSKINHRFFRVEIGATLAGKDLSRKGIIEKSGLEHNISYM